MTFLILLPAVLSMLLLGAHFFRAGLLVLTGLCIAAIVMLMLRQRWSMRAVQVLLLLGTIEWLRTTYVFVGERAANDLPWTRLAVILGSVAFFTAFSALLLEIPPSHRWFRST